jgi:hypothetical protein
MQVQQEKAEVVIDAKTGLATYARPPGTLDPVLDPPVRIEGGSARPGEGVPLRFLPRFSPLWTAKHQNYDEARERLKAKQKQRRKPTMAAAPEAKKEVAKPAEPAARYVNQEGHEIKLGKEIFETLSQLEQDGKKRAEFCAALFDEKLPHPARGKAALAAFGKCTLAHVKSFGILSPEDIVCMSHGTPLSPDRLDALLLDMRRARLIEDTFGYVDL